MSPQGIDSSEGPSCAHPGVVGTGCVFSQGANSPAASPWAQAPDMDPSQGGEIAQSQGLPGLGDRIIK